jgi:hypothetical protein
VGLELMVLLNDELENERLETTTLSTGYLPTLSISAKLCSTTAHLSDLGEIALLNFGDL